MDWVIPDGGTIGGYNHKQWLEKYNEWVFGPEPFNKRGKPLFVHGKIESRLIRRGNVDINKNDPIIVHVIGVNFIKGDTNNSGDKIDVDDAIRNACREGETEDRLDFVEFKARNETNWQNLNSGVQLVRMDPVDFTANNSSLDIWDPDMPRGPQRGAWSSKLLLMKIPDAGDFDLRSRGTGVPPYEQNMLFKIKVH